MIVFDYSETLDCDDVWWTEILKTSSDYGFLSGFIFKHFRIINVESLSLRSVSRGKKNITVMEEYNVIEIE